MGAAFLDEDPSPHSVKRALQRLSGGRRLAIFIDEFDRLEVDEVRVLFADTIKALSDQLPNVTVVLIGVADDVDRLIADHHSIERALQLIHMPRMTEQEITEIVTRGLETARLAIERDAGATRRGGRRSSSLRAPIRAAVGAGIALEDLRTRVRLRDVDEAGTEITERRERARSSSRASAWSARRDRDLGAHAGAAALGALDQKACPPAPRRGRRGRAVPTRASRPRRQRRHPRRRPRRHRRGA